MISFKSYKKHLCTRFLLKKKIPNDFVSYRKNRWVSYLEPELRIILKEVDIRRAPRRPPTTSRGR